MSHIGSYLIWAGEKMQKEHPNRSWDEIMNWLTHRRPKDIPECYSMKNYLEEVENGKSRQTSSTSRSNEYVSGESKVAGESEQDARQSGIRDLENVSGEDEKASRADHGRYPFRR